MLVNLIGCPASGKTTAAARVFASLKEAGYPAELVMEHARHYIAQKRRESGGRPVLLRDADQLVIMRRQLEHEADFVRSGHPDLIVIADASPLLATLYMSAETADSDEVQKMISEYLTLDPVMFWAAPLPIRVGEDPNRLHGRSIQEEIHKRIPQMLKRYAPNAKVYPLVDSLEGREQQIFSYVSAL